MRRAARPRFPARVGSMPSSQHWPLFLQKPRNSHQIDFSYWNLQADTPVLHGDAAPALLSPRRAALIEPSANEAAPRFALLRPHWLRVNHSANGRPARGSLGARETSEQRMQGGGNREPHAEQCRADSPTPAGPGQAGRGAIILSSPTFVASAWPGLAWLHGARPPHCSAVQSTVRNNG